MQNKTFKITNDSAEDSDFNSLIKTLYYGDEDSEDNGRRPGTCFKVNFTDDCLSIFLLNCHLAGLKVIKMFFHQTLGSPKEFQKASEKFEGTKLSCN